MLKALGCDHQARLLVLGKWFHPVWWSFSILYLNSCIWHLSLLLQFSWLSRVFSTKPAKMIWHNIFAIFYLFIEVIITQQLGSIASRSLCRNHIFILLSQEFWNYSVVDHEPILLSQHEQEVLHHWPTVPILPTGCWEDGNKITAFNIQQSGDHALNTFVNISRSHKLRFLHFFAKGDYRPQLERTLSRTVMCVPRGQRVDEMWQCMRINRKTGRWVRNISMPSTGI